ncbi:U1 small nuclear ribonucleoprotein C [Fukomys damarensis]|uniref:U1 small nuclear ribonucleoprotein C n=1 Tax=Fukomys damarensis TaxID=885580 RepID=A0A091DHS3_FUKDA|nr:U1 small nuclear ribonucleoprotein C [Fukomys damarensis]
MPKFYCDYCDTDSTPDSQSGRKTHCRGGKHEENVKDYRQKWMEEAMTAPPPSLVGPPSPVGEAPVMAMMGAPPPGTLPVGPAPGMRPPDDATSHPTHDGAHLARNDWATQIKLEEGPLSISFTSFVLLHQEGMVLLL